MDIVGLWDRIDSHLVGSRYKHIRVVKSDGTPLTRYERAMRLLLRNVPILICFMYFAYLLGVTIITYDESHLTNNQYRLYMLRSITLVSVAVPVFLSIVFQVLWQVQVLFHPQRRGIWDRLYDTYVVHDHDSRKKLGPKRTKAKALFAPVVRFCAILGVLFVLILALWVSWTSYDPPLVAAYDDVFNQQQDNVPNGQNGLYAIKNMTAPVGQGMERLHFPEMARSVSCYINQPQLQKLPQKCDTRLALIRRISDHALLLARYRALYLTPIFQENRQSQLSQQEMRLFLNMHQLQLAHWSLLIDQGDAEVIFQKWLEDITYWYQAMQGDLSVQTRNLVATPYFRDLKFLPVILAAKPDLIVKYHAEILDILQQPILGPDAWHIKQSWAIESQKLVQDGLKDVPFNFYLKPNHTRNLVYQLADDYIKMAQAPASDYETLSRMYRRKHQQKFHYGFLKKIIYNPIGHMMVYGMYQPPEIILAAHRYTAYKRQLQIYIMAKMQAVSDADMPIFLANLPIELKNPFTQTPFIWDPQERVLYYRETENVHLAHLRAMRLYF